MGRSNDPSRRCIANFSRERIFGAGVGHFSPVGGNLESEDLMFILDVNADCQPRLVERTRLFAAVNSVDGDKKHGLLLIEWLRSLPGVSKCRHTRKRK